MDKWSGGRDCDGCGRRGRRRLVGYGGRAYCYACRLGVMRGEDGARRARQTARRRLPLGSARRRTGMSVRRGAGTLAA
jgi:hypothetical protein